MFELIIVTPTPDEIGRYWENPLFKFFVRACLLFLSIALVFVAIGYVLPRQYQIKSSIYIEAPPAEVFELVNSLTNWPEWSNFNESRIPDLKIEYGEVKAGKGAAKSWTDVRGHGKLWITESEPASFVEYSLDFGDFPTMQSKIKFENAKGGTEVSWTSEGRLPSGPFYGYTGLLFPTHMTYQYEQDLLRLKELAEQ